MSEELELSGKSENTAPAESAAEPAAEPSPAPAPVQRVSAHNTAAAAALNAANEEVDIRRKGGEKAQVKIKTTKIPYEKKKGLYGYGFIALWFIGTLWLFIMPVLTSLWYSLCNTKLLDKAGALEVGMTSAGIYTEWNGFYNRIVVCIVRIAPPDVVAVLRAECEQTGLCVHQQLEILI